MNESKKLLRALDGVDWKGSLNCSWPQRSQRRLRAQGRLAAWMEERSILNDGSLRSIEETKALLVNVRSEQCLDRRGCDEC